MATIAAADDREAIRKLASMGDLGSGCAQELAIVALDAITAPAARMTLLKEVYGRLPEVPVKVLERGLADVDPEVGCVAAKELGPKAFGAAAMALVSAAGNQKLDGRVRSECLRTIGKTACLWDESVAGTVRKLSSDANPHVRRECLNAYALRDPAGALAIAHGQASDHNYYVRANAVSHMLKGGGGVEHLAEALCGDFRQGPPGSSPRSNAMHKATYGKALASVTAFLEGIGAGDAFLLASNLALDHDFRGEEHLADLVMTQVRNGATEGFARIIGERRATHVPAREGSLEAEVIRFFGTNDKLRAAYASGLSGKVAGDINPTTTQVPTAVADSRDPLVAIVDGFRNGDATFRRKCIETLRTSGAPASEWNQILLAGMRDPDAGVRAASYSSVVARNQMADRRKVSDGIRDDSPQVRLEIAKSIVREGADAHSGALADYLRGIENTSSLKSVINLLRRASGFDGLMTELQRRPSGRLRVALEELGLRKPPKG
jgi:hypothetical protein